MLATPVEKLRERANAYAKALKGAAIVETTAYAGGGSVPQAAVPSLAIALDPSGGASAAAGKLRIADRPIIARIEGGRLLLDLRTIQPSEDPIAIAALQTL
jgi:L-seryl-tRNA(Ser) seleniumtransferase